MLTTSTSEADAPRSAAWKWWVCGLLFLATVINYMDRQTLSQTAVHIKAELKLNNKQYGQVESAFATAFAIGALITGWTADRWNVRWIYPIALLGWSAAGFITGMSHTFAALLGCRFMLGLFEAGNWPCALRTTQRILPSSQRTMGNSILQSGAAVGAVVTPLIVEQLVHGEGTWSYPFFVVGATGTIWVILWLAVVRREDLALPPAASLGDNVPSLWQIYKDRRFWVCVILVIAINLTWHFFRVWLPLFMQEQHGYSESFTNWFTSAYYIATDLGSLSAGFATLILARKGIGVHKSRVLVFLGCTALTLLTIVVALLPKGPVLLGLILLIGFGSLGLYPVYYSLSQELTVRHQGKLTGTLGCITWTVSARMHPVIGQWVDETQNYSLAIALAGTPPLIGLLALMFIWRQPKASKKESP